LLRPHWRPHRKRPPSRRPAFSRTATTLRKQPFEHIDTLSGNLILTVHDLVLPGNAGRELRFQRTYNSKSAAWTFGLAGLPMGVFDVPWPPSIGDPNFMPNLMTADGDRIPPSP